jgi:hypothetical protein
MASPNTISRWLVPGMANDGGRSVSAQTADHPR